MALLTKKVGKFILFVALTSGLSSCKLDGSGQAASTKIVGRDLSEGSAAPTPTPTPTPIPAAKLNLSQPAHFYTGRCSAAWSVELQTSSNASVAASSNVPINLDFGDVTAQLYSDSECTTPLTSVQISQGQSSSTFYVKYNVFSTIQVSSSASGLSQSSLEFDMDMGFSRIDRIAGRDPGRGSNDGVGAEVRIRHPYGLIESGGVIFFTQAGYGHVVRKFEIATGAVSHVAGLFDTSGTADGVGDQARFNTPTGIELVGNDLYVTDRSNHTIRKINLTTRQVTTVAGTAGAAAGTDGIGTAARFNQPSGITKLGSSLYVVDGAGHLVRRINLLTMEVVTIAGSYGVSGTTNGVGSVARFNWPVQITNDGTFLYTADINSHTIRKIDPFTREVTTIAGLGGTSGSTDGVGTAARLNRPVGLSFSEPNLYFTDEGTNKVRKINLTSGQVSTITGTGTTGAVNGALNVASFYYPYGLVAKGSKLYVADHYNSNIRLIDLDAETVSFAAGFNDETAWNSEDGFGEDASFNWVESLASDEKYIYIPDYGNVIRRMSIETGEVVTLVGQKGSPGNTNGVGTAARITAPSGIAVQGNDLYFSGYYNCVLSHVDLQTMMTTIIVGDPANCTHVDGNQATARVHSVGHIAILGEYLYFVEYSRHTLRRMKLSDRSVETVAGTAGSFGSTDGIGAVARFRNPWGLTAMNGLIYLIDYGSHSLRVFDPATGGVTTLAGLPGTIGEADGVGSAARFYWAYSITGDGEYLYLADSGNHKIRKINPTTGEVTTLVGSRHQSGLIDGVLSAARLQTPVAIVHTKSGLFLSEGATMRWVH